jgi:hypothetical protein
MKYLFEKLQSDDFSVDDRIKINIYYKLLDSYNYDNLDNLANDLENSEPRIQNCRIEIHENTIIVKGDVENEERIFRLQK